MSSAFEFGVKVAARVWPTSREHAQYKKLRQAAEAQPTDENLTQYLNTWGDLHRYPEWGTGSWEDLEESLPVKSETAKSPYFHDDFHGETYAIKDPATRSQGIQNFLKWYNANRAPATPS